MLLPLILFSLITTSISVDCNNCKKLWGMSNEISNKPVYSVDIYMCINDPYNLYNNQQNNDNLLSSSLKDSINRNSKLNKLNNNITNNTFNNYNLTNITIINDTFINDTFINDTFNDTFINDTFINDTFNDTFINYTFINDTFNDTFINTNLSNITNTILNKTINKIIKYLNYTNSSSFNSTIINNDTTKNINTNINNNIDVSKVTDFFNYTNNTNITYQNNTLSDLIFKKTKKDDNIDTSAGVISAIVICSITILMGLLILVLVKRNKIRNLEDIRDASNNSVKINISEIKKKPRKLSINHNRLSPKVKDKYTEKPLKIMHKKSFTSEIEQLKKNNINNINDQAIIKKMVERDIYNARVDFNNKKILQQKKEFKPTLIKSSTPEPIQNDTLNNNNGNINNNNDTINPTINVIDSSNNIIKPISNDESDIL